MAARIECLMSEAVLAAAIASIVLLALPVTVLAQQSKNQQGCINALNKDGAKVAATQGKANTSCIKNAGKGKEADPQGCLRRDSKGKVAKAAAKVESDFDKKCTAETPDFGVPGVGTGTASAVATAAIEEEVRLVAEIFGSPLDDAIDTSKEGAGCQSAVSKDYEKVAATAGKVFLKCKKSALKAGASSASDLESCVQSLPDDAKVAKTVSKLAADVDKKCAGVALDAAFPGACAERTDFATCVGERVMCRVCSTFNRMDGLNSDCDALDDGVENGSCTVPEFLAADGINGGLLYDRFWAAETGFDQNDPNLDTFDGFSDFFRCKQCHAWDRLGNAASYINRAPKTTRPNVSDVSLVEIPQTAPTQDLFDLIKFGSGTARRSVSVDLSSYDPNDPEQSTIGDRMPDYGEILTDELLWDLVKYLKEEVLDSTQLYEISTMGTYPIGSTTFSDWGRDGDPVNGNALYADRCANCHGVDGTALLIEDEFTVGSHLRSKPYETWHKIKFGNPGTIMSAQGINSVSDMKDLYTALADPESYPDPD